MVVQELIEFECREVPVDVLARLIDRLLNNRRFGKTGVADENDVVCGRGEVLDGSQKLFVCVNRGFHHLGIRTAHDFEENSEGRPLFTSFLMSGDWFG